MTFNKSRGTLPSWERPPKLTPRDRDLIKEILRDTPATTNELALAFGVSRQTIYSSVTVGDYRRKIVLPGGRWASKRV